MGSEAGSMLSLNLSYSAATYPLYESSISLLHYSKAALLLAI